MGAERVAITVESRAARKEPSQAPDMTSMSGRVPGSSARGSSLSGSWEMGNGPESETCCCCCCSSSGGVALPFLLARRGLCSVGARGGVESDGDMPIVYVHVRSGNWVNVQT